MSAPPESSSPKEVESTLGKINLLLTEIEQLPANERVMFPLTETGSGPSAKPMALIKQGGINLYSGPGVGFNKVGMLPPGERLEIVGRNGDSTWWLVAMPNGLFAWVSDATVDTVDLNESIPVVTIPDQLVQPASSSSFVGSTATATVIPTPTLPPGTPTPASDLERQYVEDMPSYQKVKGGLLVPPVSASLSPDGSRMAMTEGIKLYTVATDGAFTEVWLEDSAELRPVGGALWSPNGQHLAFVVDFKDRACPPCRAVGILTPSDGSITYLEAANLDTDAPRWTQDGRLLVNAHPSEPADGITYVFDIYGLGQVASGSYVLSTSHDGQKWYPWLPGRIWRAGVSERPDSYYKD